MGNICSCLCPKRHINSRTIYDIHQQTFEMQQQIGSMNIDQSSPTQHEKITSQLSQQMRQSSQSLRHNQIDQKHQFIHTKMQQKKYIEEKNKNQNELQYEQIKIQEEDIGSSKDINQRKPLIDSDNINISTNDQINQPLIIQQKNQPEPQKQQQKKAHPNILKPKNIKKKYNPDDYRFKDQNNTFKVKKIDSIKCQQYNIDNCNQSQYFIFDITANVYIDDTNNCKIYIAPCQSTIFVRNCKNLVIIAATKQFRTYECHNCVFSLLCKSQPVIQSSSNLVFTPFEIRTYSEFTKQMNTVKLQIWNNHWSQIHNFTKKQGENHYTLRRNLQETEVLNWTKAFEQAQITQIVSDVVPFIQGELKIQEENQQKKIIVLFSKQVSKNDDLILSEVKNLKILKSFKGKIAGYGKDQRVALLLANFQQIENREKLEQMGELYQNKQQVQKYENQFFINFGDERQK